MGKKNHTSQINIRNKNEQEIERGALIAAGFFLLVLIILVYFCHKLQLYFSFVFFLLRSIEDFFYVTGRQ